MLIPIIAALIHAPKGIAHDHPELLELGRKPVEEVFGWWLPAR
jgi:hypothetical protein